ncbi:MAG: phosphoglycerate dehydrogenase [Vulcanimicrobiaceae bacterium]
MVAEPFAESGLAVLRQHGVDVVSCIGAERSALLAQLHEADGLIVRSETRVDRELLEAAASLLVVGRAGVGVDAIDVDAATQAGIVVVNTPAANTIAATEQTFALLLSLHRHTPQAYASIKSGKWERGPFIGNELFGKTLGIVGLGRIGGGVATRAQAFGMQVLACDPYISASRALAHDVELVPLEELLQHADIVTLHVPLNAQTSAFLDANRFAQMKQGALLVNCARGGVVDEDALLAALDSGHLRAAAIDVVGEEPPKAGSSGAKLHAHPRVIATPHLGGSTHEALARIATELATDLVNVLNGRPADGAVNAPIPRGADAEKLRPYVDLAYRLGTLHPQLEDASQLSPLVMTLRGEIAELDSTPLVTAFLSGILQCTTDRRISVVNADAIAAERGLSVDVRSRSARDSFAASLAVTAGSHTLVGTSLHQGLRIVEIDGFEIDANPAGSLILTRHRDVPGIIGRVGMILGDASVNISAMQVSRSAQGGEAIMVLSVDRAPDTRTLEALALIPAILSVRSLSV